MTVLDNRDADIDVPLTNQPHHIVVANPHRTQVVISGLTAISVAGAPALALAEHSPHTTLAFTAMGVSVLWFVFSLLRHDTYTRRPPTHVFKAGR